MKKITFLIAFLFCCHVLKIQAQYEVHTEDVENFWVAFDSVLTTNDNTQQIDYLQRLYAEHHPQGHIAYAQQNPQKLWTAFKKYIVSNEPKVYHGWLYGERMIDGESKSDFGYGMGYLICKSYYENAPDKTQAIREMLHYDLSTDENARQFLLKSGFVPKKDVKFVKKMKFAKIEPPKRTKVYGYKLTDENIIFTYEMFRPSADIKQASVAGSFNDWNPKAERFQMKAITDKKFELVIPKSTLKKKRRNTSV